MLMYTTMANRRIFLLVANLILIVSLLGKVQAGGSCQSYGHSCLGGHGKRNSDAPFGLHMLLQQALRAREGFPISDYRIPDREVFLKGFTDSIKELEDRRN